MEYRNRQHGRVVSRPGEDEWLEASEGWERIEPEPAAEPSEEHEERSKD